MKATPFLGREGWGVKRRIIQMILLLSYIYSSSVVALDFIVQCKSEIQLM